MVGAHPFGRVFTAAAGLGNAPVPDDWSAFDRDRIFFADRSTQISRGDHLFVLGAGRQGAVLGLFEVRSAGTEPVKSPDDPERWPFSVAVRPLAGVLPPDAVSVQGVRTPRARPQLVREKGLQEALYRAVSVSETTGLADGGLHVTDVHNLTPHSVLRARMLRTLLDMGGSGSRASVLNRMEEKYSDLWTDEDLQPSKSRPFETKWRNRVSWDRMHLVEAGILREYEGAGTPWALTKAGRAVAEGEIHAEKLESVETLVSVLWRSPRTFDPDASPPIPAPPDARADPGEVADRVEKAVSGHHRILCRLAQSLDADGWTDIEEIPLAIDLWARSPQTGRRVIFEAKTIGESNEISQIRSAVAQLLEYRYAYGDPEDELCVAIAGPLSDERRGFLQATGFLLWSPEFGFSPDWSE